MKRIITITLLIVFFIPMLAMSKGYEENEISKEAIDWYKNTKTKIFNNIDSLIESNSMIKVKDAFNLQSLDGKFEGDIDAIEYADKVISYKKSTPKAQVEALYILRYWKNLLIDPKNETDKNHLKLEGKYPPRKNDIAQFYKSKESLMNSLEKLLVTSCYPYIKLCTIETFFALDGKEGYNDKIENFLIYYSRGTNEEDWLLEATPLSNIISNRNYIKVTALRLLFKYDTNTAYEVSQEILNKDIPKESISNKKYGNYHKEVKKIIFENQKKNDKNKTPNNS